MEHQRLFQQPILLPSALHTPAYLNLTFVWVVWELIDYFLKVVAYLILKDVINIQPMEDAVHVWKDINFHQENVFYKNRKK